MRDWKGEVREAIAGADMNADAAREEAVVEELAQDLAERYQDLLREGVEEAEALRRLRGGLREPGFLAGLRPRLEARRQTLTPGVERRERLLTGVQRDVRLGGALAAGESGVCAGGDFVAGPGNWGECGDFRVGG